MTILTICCIADVHRSDFDFLARNIIMQSALYAIAPVRLSVCHTDGSVKNG